MSLKEYKKLKNMKIINVNGIRDSGKTLLYKMIVDAGNDGKIGNHFTEEGGRKDSTSDILSQFLNKNFTNKNLKDIYKTEEYKELMHSFHEEIEKKSSNYSAAIFLGSRPELEFINHISDWSFFTIRDPRIISLIIYIKGINDQKMNRLSFSNYFNMKFVMVGGQYSYMDKKTVKTSLDGLKREYAVIKFEEMIDNKKDTLKHLKNKLGMPLDENKVYEGSKKFNDFLTTYDVQYYGLRGKDGGWEGRLNSKDKKFLNNFFSFIEIRFKNTIRVYDFPKKVRIEDILQGV